MAIGEELGMVVSTKGAGRGKVSCVVVQPDGSEVEAQVLENEDGTFDIFYTAPAPGNYVIYVRFGGENVPHSPFKVTVSPRRPACIRTAACTPKRSVQEGKRIFYKSRRSSSWVTGWGGPGGGGRGDTAADLYYHVFRRLMRYQ